MASVMKSKWDGETPSLSEYCKQMATADAQPQDRRMDAMTYAFNDVITCMCREFLGSLDTVNECRKLFLRQISDFTWLAKKFPYRIDSDGERIPVLPIISYQSLISVLASDDAIQAKARGEFVKGDPHEMMRNAGFEIDEGLGLDIKELLTDAGLFEIVAEPKKEKPKPRVVTTFDSVLFGVDKKSSVLDQKSWNPKKSLSGAF